MANKTTKELTKKDKYNMLLALDSVKENAVLVDFINHELELLGNKSRKVDEKKAQDSKENGEKVLAGLTRIGKAVTVTELITGAEELSGMTNQKVTHILSTLLEEGKVERTLEKKVARYSVVVEEEEIEEEETEE